MKHMLRMIALLALVGTSASAQPWSGKFDQVSNPSGGKFYNKIGVGPYKGSLSLFEPNTASEKVKLDITQASSGFSFWCVDGKGAYKSVNPISLYTIASIGDEQLRIKLAQAAYVTTLFDPGANPSAAAMSNYNAAIWSIMGSSPNGWAPKNEFGEVESYIADAESKWGLLDLNNFYYIRTDAAGLHNIGGAQELIFQGSGSPFIVPEPGSVALLATGLFALAGLARRRKIA